MATVVVMERDETGRRPTFDAVRDGLRTVDLGGEATTSEFTEGVIGRVRA